jgi:putative addiction module component (TIGR02574 family)
MTQQDILNSSLLSEIKKLSVSEKILIVEDIWDSIALSGEELSVTPEQQEELDKRVHDYQSNPENGSSWDDVKRRLESNL